MKLIFNWIHYDQKALAVVGIKYFSLQSQGKNLGTIQSQNGPRKAQSNILGLICLFGKN